MRICESCGKEATKCCSSMDQPELHFCDACYARHVKETHHGKPLPGAPEIVRKEAVARSKKTQDLNFLEQIVWDALKQSRCPAEHRYIGPSGKLPCRWCRTAHAVVLVLRKMETEGIRTSVMLGEIERLAGWKLP